MKCHRGQDFVALRDAALLESQPFEDPCFPAGPTSLGYDKLGPCSRFSDGIVWKRPWEITPDPQFIVRGASRFDLCQGKLGDCWFLAAISSLTLNKKLLARVVPMQQGFCKHHAYAGIFHFRFWRYGEWVDVVVDDRLPTLKGKLAFVRSCESNEFWGALLEKAYAKVCGSYEALRSGRFTEALVDFTGGVKEHYLLSEALPGLWLFLKKAENAGSLMGAATYPRAQPRRPAERGPVRLGPHYAWCHGDEDGCGPGPRYDWGRSFGLRPSASFSAASCADAAAAAAGERLVQPRPEQKTPDGLVLGHAYSITGVERVKVDGEVVELVRLRNPWGKVEWNGAWSDSSPVWKCVDCDAKRKLQVKLEDGEFWMSMEDFRRHFKRLDVCHLTPDDVEDGPRKNWTVTMFRGGWRVGHSAGGTCKATFWKNPQYLLSLRQADEGQDGGCCGGCGGCGGCDGCDGGGCESRLCTLIVSLMQKPRDAQRNRAPWFSIGFAIYKARGPRRLSRDELSAAGPVALLDRFDSLREVSQRLHLPPGRYVLVPCSLQPDEAADFLLRVFCCNCDCSELTDELQECEAPQEPIPRYEPRAEGSLRDVWSELFQQHASQGTSIEATELKAVLSKAASKYPATVSQSFSSGTCQKIIILLNGNVSTKLAPREFEILYKKFTETHVTCIGVKCEYSYLCPKNPGQRGRNLYHQLRLHADTTTSLHSVHRALFKAGLPVTGELEKHTLLRYFGGKKKIAFEDFFCCLLHIDALSGTVKAMLKGSDMQPAQKEWMKRIMFF